MMYLLMAVVFGMPILALYYVSVTGKQDNHNKE